MAEEKIYIIPLRKEWLKVPRWKRSRKAVRAVREYLIKHMKSEDVKLGKYLNEFIWKRGMKKPPGKIKVKVSKDGDVVRAELFDAPENLLEKDSAKEEKKEDKKSEKLKETKEKKETKEDKKEKEKNLLEKASAKEKKKPEISEQEKFLEKQNEKPKKDITFLDKEKAVKLEKENIITESGKK